MGPVSAGLLAMKPSIRGWLFLLVHPGGPFFKKKDQGFWTIPKGLVATDEQLMAAAIREFQEETGIVPEAPFHSLGEIKQKSGKRVHAWSFKCPTRYDYWDPNNIVSNTFNLEWPPKSGRYQNFPEIDSAAWFNYEEARIKIMEAQIPFLDAAINSFDG